MAFIDKSQARGISKRIVRELSEALDPNRGKIDSLELTMSSPKKRARKIKQVCRSKASRFVFLEEKNSEKTSWEIFYGEWSLGYRGAVRPKTIKEYDRFVFDLCFSYKSALHQKFFFIILTKHALERMIMRSGENLTSIESVYRFLRKLTKDAILAGMSMLEGNRGHVLHSNGFYLPLVLEQGLNLESKAAINIVIKTVMPEDYVVKAIELLDRNKFRATLYELLECLSATNDSLLHK